MDFLCFYFPLFCIHWLMGKEVVDLIVVILVVVLIVDIL